MAQGVRVGLSRSDVVRVTDGLSDRRSNGGRADYYSVNILTQ